MSILVVLGAGEDQACAYLEARRRGLATIGVDMRADAPAVGLADEFLHVSTRNAQAVLEALRGRPVIGVIAPAGDAAQPTVRAIAEALGVAVTVSAEAALCSSDKTAFRAVVKSLGLPCYASEVVDGADDVRGHATSWGYPVVVKPGDSSGSKGVSVVASAEQVDTAFAQAAAVRSAGDILVEEFVVGRHLAAECFLHAGQLVLCMVTERETTGVPHMITTVHRAPALLEPAVGRRIETDIARVAEHLGLESGPLNLDLVLTADGTPYLIELGARLGGNGMPGMVLSCTGADTVAAAVDLACGREPVIRTTRDCAAGVVILHSALDGAITAIDGLPAARALPGVEAIELFADVGDVVRSYTKAANKIGYVQVAAPDADRLGILLAAVDRTLRITVQPAIVGAGG